MGNGLRNDVPGKNALYRACLSFLTNNQVAQNIFDEQDFPLDVTHAFWFKLGLEELGSTHSSLSQHVSSRLPHKPTIGKQTY